MKTYDLSLLNDSDTLAGGNTVSDFGSVTLVVHQEELDVTFVVDEELLESRRKNVTGLLVGSVTYFVRTSSLVYQYSCRFRG